MKCFRLEKIIMMMVFLATTVLTAEEAYKTDWIQQFGTIDTDITKSISSDVNGNIFVATSSSYGESSINKYSNDGLLLWSKLFEAQDITNSNDYIFAIGNNSLVKYDTNGTEIWVKTVDSASFITSDSNGDLFVAGNFNSNCFISKYSNDGSLLWYKEFGSPDYDLVYSITTDNDNNILITGATSGIISGDINYGGWTDAYILKYNANGILTWAKQFGTSGLELGLSINVDTNNNIFVIGQIYGTFDGEIRIGQTDAFIAKYSNTGMLEWNRQFGTSDWDYIEGSTIDNNGNIFVTGYTDGTFDGELNSGESAFVTKHSNDGVHLWSKQFGEEAVGISMTTDISNNIFVTGFIWGTFDGEVNLGNSDAFLMKLSSPNTAPVAIATTPEDVVIAGTVVELDGTQSYDPDADNITYKWSWIEKPLNSSASFSDANSSSPIFTTDLVGNYVASLKVNDGNMDSSNANLSIEAITVQTAATRALQNAIVELQAMDDSSFKNAKQKQALTTRLICWQLRDTKRQFTS